MKPVKNLKPVKESDLKNAHGRWLEVWNSPLLCDWSRFLGEQHFPLRADESLWGEIRWMINDVGAERVRLINESPYWRTLLKAWEVQYITNKLG